MATDNRNINTARKLEELLSQVYTLGAETGFISTTFLKNIQTMERNVSKNYHKSKGESK